MKVVWDLPILDILALVIAVLSLIVTIIFASGIHQKVSDIHNHLHNQSLTNQSNEDQTSPGQSGSDEIPVRHRQWELQSGVPSE